jgi:hypothetical protein
MSEGQNISANPGRRFDASAGTPFPHLSKREIEGLDTESSCSNEIFAYLDSAAGGYRAFRGLAQPSGLSVVPHECSYRTRVCGYGRDLPDVGRNSSCRRKCLP